MADTDSKEKEIKHSTNMKNTMKMAKRTAFLKETAVSSMVNEYLTWSDLSALGSSPDAIRQAFNKIWGKNPDGIALNDTTWFDAVNPPITQTYNHYCYKILGNPTYGKSSTDPTGTQAIVGTNTVVNNGDKEASMSVSVAGSWQNTATVSSSITAGMTMKAGITLEGLFEMGMEFSVSTTVGQSNSETFNKTATTSVTVPVPAKSSVTVNMVATFKKESMDYSIPIQVSGMLGANFPDTVQGHYFWFNGIGSLTGGKTSGNVTGTIKGTMGADVNTQIQPAKKL